MVGEPDTQQEKRKWNMKNKFFRKSDLYWIAAFIVYALALYIAKIIILPIL